MIYSIFAYLAGSADLVGGIIVLFCARSLKKEAKQIFFLFTLSLALWSFGLANLYLTSDQKLATYWAKVIYTGLILFPIFYLHFSLTITPVNKGFKKFLPWAYIIGFLLLVVNVKGSLVNVGYIENFKQFFPVGGKIYYPFFLILMLVGTGFLLRGYSLSKSPFQTNRIKYLALGVVVALPGGIADLLPRFGCELYHHISHISSVCGMLIGSYALIKQKWEERPIKRTYFYSLLVSLIALALFLGFNKIEALHKIEILPQIEGFFPVFFVVLIIISLFPLDVFQIIISTCFFLPFLVFRAYTLPIISGIAIVAIHHPLRKEVEKFISKEVFKLEDFQKRIKKEVREGTYLVFDEPTLISKIIEVLKKHIKYIDKIFIMTLDEKKGEYRNHQTKEVIKANEPIIDWLKEGRELAKEEIGEDAFIKEGQRESLKEVFERIGAEILFPIIYGEDLIGILCLGERKMPSHWTYKSGFRGGRYKYEVGILLALCKDVLPALFKNIKIAGLRRLVILQKTTSLIQQKDDLEEMFYIILTAITHKDMLGFNTAILFWRNEEGILKGEMGMDEKVYRNWEEKEIIEKEPTFDECISMISIMKEETYKTELNTRVKGIPPEEIEKWSIFKQTPEGKGELFDKDHFDYSKVKGLFGIDIETFCIISLKIKDEVKGFLMVDKKYGGDEITPFDISTLKIFAERVTIAIEERRSLKELEKNIEMLETLNEVVRDWAVIYELDTFLNSFVQAMSKRLRGYCSFYLLDKKKGKSFFKTSRTQEHLMLGEITEPMTKKIESHLFISPVMWKDRFVGGIILERNPTEKAFTKAEKRFFNMLINYIDISGSNISMFEEMTLSGDKNREESLVENLIVWQDVVARINHKIGSKIYSIAIVYDQIEKEINKKDDMIEVLSTEKISMNEVIRDTKALLTRLKEFANPSKMHIQSIDINTLLKRSIIIRNDQIELEFRLNEGIPSIEADSEKLRGIFTELTENADYFMSLKRFILQKRKEGTKNSELSKEIKNGFGITAPLNDYLAEVNLKELEKEKIIVNTEFVSADRSDSYDLEPKDYIKIGFSDTGPGIHPDVKAKMFEPLFTMRKRGTGLGLSIIERDIILHRGKIKEEGVFGEGARFVIFLPVKQRELG